MEKVPALANDVEHKADPEETMTLAHPEMATPLEVKATLPVGADALLMVAVKTAVCAISDGFWLEAITVEVTA